MSDERIEGFLERCSLMGVERAPVSGDASSRRYERITHAKGEETGTLILMDTPNPDEDIRLFMEIGKVLISLGLSAPEVFAVDLEQGLALLEDFGDDTFGRLFAFGANEAELYTLAVDTLAELHRNFRPAQVSHLNLPEYDINRFVDQVMLFADVAMPAMGRPVDAHARQALEDAWRKVLPDALKAPRSLLLRDFHVDNLILLKGRAGVQACGLLDFQMAGLGPSSYDLVSLLEDARRDVPTDLAESLLNRYLSTFPELDAEMFRRSYAVMGAIRHARIVAIFARLALRDGKRGYLAHLPRVWRLLNGQLAKPVLEPVRAWFDQYLPAELRTGRMAAEDGE